ncbi:MAG: hypothetical protein V3S44_06555 [Alphaproteobacteria bacterium]
MSTHHYPPGALYGDYMRAGVGLVVTGGPLLFLRPTAVVAAVLGCLAALFAFFALRTACRQMTVIEVTPEAIRTRGPGGRRFAWGDIERVRLDYYSTRRDSANGWMQLKLMAGRRQIRIDSTVDDFARVAASVAGAAAVSGAAMTDTTRGNFQALGIAAPGAAEPAA